MLNKTLLSLYLTLLLLGCSMQQGDAESEHHINHKNNNHSQDHQIQSNQNKPNRTHLNQNDQNHSDKSQTQSKQTTDIAWITQNKKGFFFTQSQAVDEYDESLTPIGQLDDYELTPVDIIAISHEKLPSAALYKDNSCQWANFVKIRHQGKEKIVFGGYVQYLTKQHAANTLSLWETDNYYTDVGDENGLTGCDNLHHLLLQDANGVYHNITENIVEAEEPSYISLVSSDVAEDHIEVVTENSATLSIKIARELQDGTQSYGLNIFKRDGSWWSDAAEPKPALFDKRVMLGMSIDEIEDKAVKLHQKSGANTRNTDVALVADYIEFMQRLIQNRPDTMQHSFANLVAENALDTATSTDERLRFYSFNTQTGGTMQVYHTLYQIKDKGKITTTEVPKDSEDDNGYFVSNIHTLVADAAGKKETYYLVIANRIASNRDVAQIAKAYTIKQGKLIPVKLFKTAKKSYAEIPVGYNFFSALKMVKNTDREHERPIRIINYNKNKAQLTFSVVNEDGDVTDKKLVYQWTGNGFNYQGLE